MRSFVEVNVSHIHHNIEQVRRISGDSLFMAIVKSNAYGLGMVELSHYIEPQVDRFGVNSVDEAIQLAQSGITKPVHILAPYFDERLIESMIPTIDNIADLYRYEALCAKNGYHGRFHLKVNTGMNRFGLEPEQIEPFMNAYDDCGHVTMEGVFSHFGSSYEKQPVFTKKQWAAFMACKTLITSYCKDRILFHIANSAASIDLPESQLDMVRIGNAMYGFRSSAADIDLLPTYKVKTKILSIRSVKKKEYIGYGCTSKAKRDMQVAVISFGGYDGFDFIRQPKSVLRTVYQHFFAKPKLWMRSKSIPTLGKLSMNYILADVTDIQAKPGEEVTIRLPSILALKESVLRKYI
ncbi:alanine racemase [Paenibacillus solisilvae]|uniref:Alanine racemase n=1 Tax=Paenibacillus solisilvae TaxID=2486751 RepID=A0ABW0W103_9BACL